MGKAMAPHSSTLAGKFHGRRSLVGCGPWGQEESDTTERLHLHFTFSCIGEEMATHSSILAWRIPGTEEPSGLLSLGSHRVGHDWRDLVAAAAACLEVQPVLWCNLCFNIPVGLRLSETPAKSHSCLAFSSALSCFPHSLFLKNTHPLNHLRIPTIDLLLRNSD